MRRLFHLPVPLWVFVILVLGMGVGMLAVFSLFRGQIFDYELFLPTSGPQKTVTFTYGEQVSFSDPDFFQKVKNNFIAEKANFIEADLSQKKLLLYKDGILQTDVPILMIGKEGSWWETPAGIYKILTKEKSHFSTFGKVYQPWSMSFQGNFFIHGWPYYPDGTPVASTYSGGCIRLSNDDAEKIYEAAKVGMPVLVFKNDFISDNFQYRSRVPEITASHYLVADIKNNFIFLEKGKAENIPFGPFSELLAALSATDYINIERKISLNPELLRDTENSRFFPDERVTPYDLLYPMLLESDPAPFHIFANFLGETRFISLMQDKAGALGMNQTHFTSLHQYGSTTPENLFSLAKYIYNNRRFVFDLSAGRLTNMAYGVSLFSDIPNENIFADDSRFVGGKALKDDDGTESFFGVFEVDVREGKRPIFIFLFHSQNIRDEVQNILNFISNTYQ